MSEINEIRLQLESAISAAFKIAEEAREQARFQMALAEINVQENRTSDNQAARDEAWEKLRTLDKAIYSLYDAFDKPVARLGRLVKQELGLVL